jgi:phenylpropionate dioxygenase-like ring-hydroxylating dioxygenase large terminal subunit
MHTVPSVVARWLADAASTMKPLAQASTLPPRFYVDPDVYTLEKQRIFRRSWLSVGRTDQVAAAGDYVCHDLVGEPLVIVRGRDDRIRVLSRVCRHRGMLVAEGAGNCRSLRCPYHRWTYGLDGKLIGAPGMTQAEGFHHEEFGLSELRSEIWGGWIFVNLDANAAPLGRPLEPLARVLLNYEVARWHTADTLRYDMPCNWKVIVDNFMESFHHIGVHDDTFESVAPGMGTYADDVEGPYAILHNPIANRDAIPTVLRMPGLAGKERSEFLVIAIFPFHLFAVVPDHAVYYFQVQPISVDRTTVNIAICTPPGSQGPEYAPMVKGLGEYVATIQQEDIPICTKLQASYGSSLARPGRYSHLEKALWQFHRFLLEQLAVPEASS